MNRGEFFQAHRELCQKMQALVLDKNMDYAEDQNPFSNFSRVEALGIASTEQGFLTRMLDKLARLTTFAQKGTLKVKDESALDTCLDLANYALILAIYIKQKEKLK